MVSIHLFKVYSSHPMWDRGFKTLVALFADYFSNRKAKRTDTK